MFRYLEKYVGKYRVLAPYDLDTKRFPVNDTGGVDDSFDDLYIPCRKGVIKHTYEQDRLAVWFYSKSTQGKNVYKALTKKYPKLDLKYEDYEEDCAIYFNSEDINKVSTIVKPRTSGASVKPYSSKNLPKPDYNIPGKDLARLYSITKDMDRVTKMHFIKACNKEFNNTINKIKGKKYDAEKERKESNMKPKEFIHSIGLWDDYIEFVSEQYNKEVAK